jgi:hypothetical protein
VAKKAEKAKGLGHRGKTALKPPVQPTAEQSAPEAITARLDEALTRLRKTIAPYKDEFDEPPAPVTKRGRRGSRR